MKTTSYYVQAKVGSGFPQIVWHSKEGYKFLAKKGAQDLMNIEKKSSPTTKFRIVKLVETATFTTWE